MSDQSIMRHIGKDLIFPIAVWILITIVFLNVKNIPYNFTDKENLVLRYLVKFIMTIILPLSIIHLYYKEKRDFGIFFPNFPDSFTLSLWAYAIAGPAGITFLIIGLIGWTFQDWFGSITLTVAYLVALYFIPKVTAKLPTRTNVIGPDGKISIFLALSLFTVIFTYFTYDYIQFPSKILYYIFIVGLGEELLFRGYLQSSFNRYFGRSFIIGNVKYGWGLILSSILFGMMHALVVVPPLWPWLYLLLLLD